MTSTTRFQLRRTLTVAGLSLLGLCASGISHAQSWPSKPIRIVVGFAPGGIRTGKVKLLAVVSEKRSPFFPDVPTVAEQGFKGANLDIWFGMWAPNGTPADVIARLNREVAKALASPTLKARYAELGGENVALDTAEFKALLANEARILGALIRDQKISVE